MTVLAGIYIHIPFCIRKCLYCDFYSITDLSLIDSFSKALKKEMRLIDTVSPLYDTLYIGGGTPSALKPEILTSIIEQSFSCFNISKDAEITVEVNPGTADRRVFESYKNNRVNRVSIGIQSFQDQNLSFLGRAHSGKEALKAVDDARKAGFDNIGIDMIYGLPGQTEKSWLFDLKQVLALTPAHLSCYMLTYEKGTLLYGSLQKGGFHPLPDEQCAALFKTTMVFLADHGYRQYEISNFSRLNPDGSEPFRSQHNQKYWAFTPYTGLGPCSHSFINSTRSWNYADMSAYISSLSRGRLPVEEREDLTIEQQMIEAVCLGLRTTAGIQIEHFNQRFNMDYRKIFSCIISRLERNGYIHMSQDHCRLTKPGMLLLDSIVSEFVCGMNMDKIKLFKAK